MVAPRQCICLLAFFGLACGSSDSGKSGFLEGGDEGGDTSASDSGRFVGLQGVEVLSPRDNAGHLTVASGQFYYSTQYDPAVYTWNPETGDEEKVTWDWRDLEAFAVSDGRIFGSFSDSGIEGWVSELLPPKDEEELASQGSDGRLFRRPSDLVVTEQRIWVVDEKLELVWEIDRGSGSAAELVGVSGVLAVVQHQGRWVVGGESGVQDATGLLDQRKATALYSTGNQIWAVNVDDGIYKVGGDSWALQGPARPGPFIVQDELAYVVDEVGGGIWAFELPTE